MCVFVLLVQLSDSFIFIYAHKTLAQNVGTGILIIKNHHLFIIPRAWGLISLHYPHNVDVPGSL